MESKAVGFEQWVKAYGFGLRITQLFTEGKIAALRPGVESLLLSRRNL